MALAFVQGVSSSGSAGVSPQAAPAFATAIAAKDLIVVLAGGDGGVTGLATSVSDSLGNTYTRVPSFDIANTGGTLNLDAFYAVVTAGGSSNVVSLTFNSANENCVLVVQHFNGFTGTATLDKSRSQQNASSTTTTSGATATLSTATELVVGLGIHASTISAYSLGSGYTNLTTVSIANRQSAMESKVVASTTAVTATFTSAAARLNIGGVLTFKNVTSGTTYTKALTASVLPTGSLSSSYIPVVTIGSLADDFNDNSLDSAKWDTGITGTSTVIETNSQIEITMPSAATASDYATLNSHNSYSLLGSAMYLKTIATPNPATFANTTLTAINSSTNWVRTVFEAGTLYFQYTKAGTQTTVASVAFNSTTMQWWKIREASGVVYWDTSSDGNTWTNQASFTHGMDSTLVSVKANIESYTYQVETNPGTFKFDNFNTPGGAFYTRSLTASVSPAGAFAKQTRKAFIAGLTSGGTFIKQSTRSFVASLTPTGSLVKRFIKSFTASLSPSGIVSTLKVRLMTLTASLSPTGAISRRTTKSITASMASAGSLSKSIRRAMTASLSPTGTLAKRGIRSFTAGLPMTGSLIRTVNKKFTAGMTSSGLLSKAIGKKLVATLTPAGSLARQLVKVVLLTANMTFIGSVGILRRMLLTANMTFSTSFVARWLSGVPSIFAPLLAVLQSTIQSINEFGSRNDVTVTDADNTAIVQDTTSIATVDGAVTITDISANTNTQTLNNPTNKAEL